MTQPKPVQAQTFSAFKQISMRHQKPGNPRARQLEPPGPPRTFRFEKSARKRADISTDPTLPNHPALRIAPRFHIVFSVMTELTVFIQICQAACVPLCTLQNGRNET